MGEFCKVEGNIVPLIRLRGTAVLSPSFDPCLPKMPYSGYCFYIFSHWNEL